jgi:integrase
MAYGGLRGGEVGGLKMTDIVREGKKCGLRIRRQVTHVTRGDAKLSPLKTRAAMRTVYIPCELADEIEAMVEEFGAARDGRIFHGRKGAYRYASLINHSVSSAGKRVGMDVNAHQLRHTAVSLLLAAGANIQAVQRMIGHSDIRVTLQTYGHLYQEGLSDLADIMADLRKHAAR